MKSGTLFYVLHFYIKLFKHKMNLINQLEQANKIISYRIEVNNLRINSTILACYM